MDFLPWADVKADLPIRFKDLQLTMMNYVHIYFERDSNVLIYL